jgi:uncharacterized Tic20 family protein
MYLSSGPGFRRSESDQYRHPRLSMKEHSVIETSPSSSDKIGAMAVHVAGIFLGPIPSLIVYLAVNDNPWLKEQARNALNFQLTMLIVFIIGIVLKVIGIGFLIVWAVEIANIVFSIIAALKANQGETYKYPLSVDLIKA